MFDLCWYLSEIGHWRLLQSFLLEQHRTLLEKVLQHILIEFFLQTKKKILQPSVLKTEF